MERPISGHAWQSFRWPLGQQEVSPVSAEPVSLEPLSVAVVSLLLEQATVARRRRLIGKERMGTPWWEGAALLVQDRACDQTCCRLMPAALSRMSPRRVTGTKDTAQNTRKL